MKTRLVFRTAALVTAAAGVTALAAAGPGAQSRTAEARLDELIERAIEEGQPFFTPEERAVIERACGYGPGTWNEFQVNMVGEVFHCTNGRRVSSPAVRAIMAAAEPKIDAHIDRVMERPEIAAAIERTAHEAEPGSIRKR